MISRPSSGGQVRNGMYAGVGKITGVPGREKTVIAASRPLTTSGSGRTRAGSTVHP